jgi:hypothetical protein
MEGTMRGLSISLFVAGFAAFATAASAGTFFKVDPTSSFSQTNVTITPVSGENEWVTSYSMTNNSTSTVHLGMVFGSRTMNGQAGVWNQGDLSFEINGMTGKPETSSFFAFTPQTTDFVPDPASGFNVGDSLAFFDFGVFTPGETKQVSTGFLFSTNVNGISGARSIVEELSVPEPASWAFMLLGLGLVGCTLRNRRGQAASFA